MNDEQLKALWQTSNANKDIFTINPPKIFIEMNAKIQQFEKDIKNRNAREITVAMLLIPVSIFFAFTIPFTLSKIGAVVLLCSCLWIIYYLKSNSSTKAMNMQLSLKEQLQTHKQHILKEKQILENVLVWYMLPILSGLILLSAGHGINRGFFIQLFILVIMAIGIYFLNKKAANEMNPLIEEIDHSIKHIDSKH